MTNLKIISSSSASGSASNANEAATEVTVEKTAVASASAASAGTIAAAARTPEPGTPGVAAAKASGTPFYVRVNRALTLLGLTWFVPFVKLLGGENPRDQLRAMWLMIGIPAAFFALFLALWAWSASQIHTSLGTI
ncbi:MAG: hypothetical protein WAV22_07505, partial [Porticoccaceae bacterium]